MADFKTFYQPKTLALHERAGLRIAQVPRFLIDGGLVSMNERTDLTIFAFICIVVAGVAFGQAYCFSLYILGLPPTPSLGIGVGWGIIVFNVDRGLFRNKKDKATQRIIYIVFSTLILSIGISYLICKGDLEKIVLEENAAHNQAIQDNMKKNMETYDADVSKRRDEYSQLQQDFAKSAFITQTNDQISDLARRLDENTRGVSDSVLRTHKTNLIYLKTNIGKLEAARNQQIDLQNKLLSQAKKVLDQTVTHRDSMQKLFKGQTASAIAPADLSRSALLTALIRHYFDLSIYHVVAMLGILLLECIPLWVRIKNDDYGIVPILAKISNAREYEIQEIMDSIYNRSPETLSESPAAKKDFEPIYQENHI